MGKATLHNAPVILPTPEIRATVAYYRDVFGFTVVEHYDNRESFAALYRDDVEIVLVQAKRGEFEPNRVRYGAGYDVYLDPDTLEGVDDMYAELASKGARIVREPALSDYGSYEFVVEDLDGRHVCVGLISDRGTFFWGAFD